MTRSALFALAAGLCLFGLLLFGGCAACGAAAWYAWEPPAPHWRLPVPVPVPFPVPVRPHRPHGGELWVVSRDNCPHCERQAHELAKADLCGFTVRHQHGPRGSVTNVRSYPTLAIRSKGREVARHEGCLAADELTRWLGQHPCEDYDGTGAGGSVVGGRQHDGEELTVDVPEADQAKLKNIGSRIDGAGMCVDSSATIAALAHGMRDFGDFRDFWARREKGGNFPQGLDRQIKAYCAEKGIPVPPYVQYEGPDPGPVLDALDRTGRMACITYGTSPRYHGQTIAHMVCCPKFSGRYGVVLDNNFPGEEKYEWMDRAELVRRMKYPRGTCWIFAWLTPGPPPTPH